VWDAATGAVVATRADASRGSPLWLLPCLPLELLGFTGLVVGGPQGAELWDPEVSDLMTGVSIRNQVIWWASPVDGEGAWRPSARDKQRLYTAPSQQLGFVADRSGRPVRAAESVQAFNQIHPLAWQAGTIVNITPPAPIPVTALHLYEEGGVWRLAVAFGGGAVEVWELGAVPPRATHVRSAKKLG
jgi:hypothetical protein